MSGQIPLFEIAWDEDDISNVVQSISRGSYWAKGPFVDRFESALERYLDVEHAVVVNSGTTAIVAALRGAGIGSGDEVIVPSFTFIATANAVREVGAEPVFADIEMETYGLDPASVRACVTDRTAAVVPVHLYGTPCRIEELMRLADSEDLILIEDAAEAFGSTVGGTYAGTFGDAGILSFCQNKVVVTGEGGAVVTDDNELAHRVRLYRSHGRETDDYFDSAGSGEYVAHGTNIRMSDVTAALGCAQLEKVDELIAGRRDAAQHLTAGLADVDGVRTPAPREGATHVYQLYTIELAAWVDRRTVVETLAERGVSSKVYWDTPVHRTTYYRETASGPSPDLPNTDATADRVLSLPMYPDLTPSQADRIVEAVEAAT
jgi:dTDP-4-amino-4,6-dideoxygalactose transaminase